MPFSKSWDYDHLVRIIKHICGLVLLCGLVLYFYVQTVLSGTVITNLIITKVFKNYYTGFTILTPEKAAIIKAQTINPYFLTRKSPA